MTTPKQLAEITISFKVLVTDTTLPATVSNIYVSQADVRVNGVENPNWNEQQIVESGNTMPKWTPISASLKNEMQALLLDHATQRMLHLGLIEED